MRLKAIGASVIGPSHSEKQLPNQDYLSLQGYRGGWISAVCDGLGSHEYSQLGSRAASHAVQELWRESHIPSLADITEMNQNIHRRWLQTISPYPVTKSSTTCLYCVVDQQGAVAISQLGDGLILYKKSGVFYQLTPEDTNYGNQTNALGSAYKADEWTNYRFSLQQQGDGVILMTDGVSDDLIPEKLADFYESIYQLSSKATRRQAKNWLQHELNDWATPKHGDDKTLSAIFRV